jgi:hypothetical protein
MAQSQLDTFERGSQARLEAFVRCEYERCRPRDTFGDLQRRARFDKDSRGLLKHWLEVGRRRIAADWEAEESACSEAAE